MTGKKQAFPKMTRDALLRVVNRREVDSGIPAQKHFEISP